MASCCSAAPTTSEEDVHPDPTDDTATDWIDDLTDDQCLEVFWLYLETPDEFFAKYPKPLLGYALRYALRMAIAARSPSPR